MSSRVTLLTTTCYLLFIQVDLNPDLWTSCTKGYDILLNILFVSSLVSQKSDYTVVVVVAPLRTCTAVIMSCLDLPVLYLQLLYNVISCCLLLRYTQQIYMVLSTLLILLHIIHCCCLKLKQQCHVHLKCPPNKIFNSWYIVLRNFKTILVIIHCLYSCVCNPVTYWKIVSYTVFIAVCAIQ